MEWILSNRIADLIKEIHRFDYFMAGEKKIKLVTLVDSPEQVLVSAAYGANSKCGFHTHYSKKGGILESLEFTCFSEHEKTKEMFEKQNREHHPSRYDGIDAESSIYLNYAESEGKLQELKISTSRPRGGPYPLDRSFIDYHAERDDGQAAIMFIDPMIDSAKRFIIDWLEVVKKQSYYK
jgi:hypothetical protein